MNPEPQSDRHRVLHQYTDPNQFLKCSISSMLALEFCWCAHPNRLFGDGKDCLSGAQCLCDHKGTYAQKVCVLHIIHVHVLYIIYIHEMCYSYGIPGDGIDEFPSLI